MEIQDIDKFVNSDLLTKSMSDSEIIKAITSEGANQMTCVKALMKLRGYKLSKANLIVSKSKEWERYAIGNEKIKEMFFSLPD